MPAKPPRNPTRKPPPIRDRIQELRRVPARQLLPHPQNWRTHPDNQRSLLSEVLHQIGYAGALIARQLPDGRLQLIDGHLRAETTPDSEVPVLIVDLSEDEANLLLAVHDPIAALAQTSHDHLAGLVASIEQKGVELASFLDDLTADADRFAPRPTPEEVPIPRTFQVVVDCRDDADQQSLYHQMKAEGRRCRVLTL